MPNGDFGKQLANWEKEAKKHWELAQKSQQLITDYGRQLEFLSPQPREPLSTWEAFTGRTPTDTAQLAEQYEAARKMPGFSEVTGILGVKERLSIDIKLEASRLNRSEFYYRLYSDVPMVIAGGAANTTDEILSKMPAELVNTLNPAELEEAKVTIQGMLGAFTGAPPAPPPGSPEEIELPELIPPTEVPPVTLANISTLTKEEILKAAVGIGPPEPIMSTEEWNDLLRMEGYTDADLEEVYKLETEAARITDEWQERDNQLAAFREGMAELPDYKLTDVLKEMIIQPGLAAAEIAGIYFEHVSMPLAGLLYKTFIPDIEAEYQRLRQTESTWEAAAHAWQEWDQNWALKYLLMEGLVDPLTYVGWGIAAKLTRPIPYVGRLVGAFEKGAMELFELPFDMIKAGVKRIPKTITQRAMIAQHQASQYVKQYLTKYTGKPFYAISMREFTTASEKAIQYAFRHPQSEDLVARAGRELLKHAPMDEAATRDWGIRLATTLSPEDITRVTVENLDNLFEDFFMRKLITQREAAGRLLRILNVANPDDEALKLAERLLGDRANAITTRALAFTQAKTLYLAMRALARRNFKLYIAAEESVAALARKEAGRYTNMLHGIDVKTQAIWRNQIDRMVVRPFAEAYLTFGMYGPMNVLEDYIRSALGGIIPRRMTVEAWDRLSIGLSVDPELSRFGLSEMIGPLARTGTEEGWSNWILQLATLGQKGWAEKLYTRLVRLPGGFGMDVRRNFIARKYLQILHESGGDAYQALMKAGPKPPRLVDRKLMRELEAQVYKLKTAGNPDILRGAKDTFTRKRIVRNEVNNILKEHPDLPNSARDYIMKAYDDDILLKEAVNIDSTLKEAGQIVLDDFIRGPEVAAQQFRMLADELTKLEVKNPQEMAWCIQQLNIMSQMYGATPRQVIAQATVRSRGLPLAERRARFDADLDRLHLFLDTAGADIERTLTRLQTLMKEPGVAFSDTYVTKADRLFDIMSTKREYAQQFRSQNIATRHEIFAAATARDLKDPSFWDDFYLRMDGEYHTFNVRMAELDGQLTQAIEAVDLVAGIKPFARPAIVVKDRPLATQDVANLVGARGDDISRALLDTLVTQNDKDMFVAYVMAKVRTGDRGFTKEAVGSVYDQVVNSLNIKPESMSWVTGKQMELDAIRRELHALHGSKLLPEEEITAIHRYIDDTANAVQDLMFQPVVKPEPFNRATQEALRESFEGLPNATAFELAWSGWVHRSERGALKSLVDLAGDSPEYLARMRNAIRAQYGDTITVYRGGIGREDLISVSTDIDKARGFARVRGEKVTKHSINVDDVLATGDVADFEIIIRRSSLKPPTRPVKPILKQEFADYDYLRQSSMDEAHKWYYKEYTDYTNANAFDAMMKSIYPYWTYESQRWFWLPRSFVRHPGTFTAFERWQNNTDYGYIHIPGTSIDWNPFRGTIYGTMTTRLVRRDFPEYYDALGVAGGYVEFMDFLSRYGFYPGAHMGIPLAMFGGLEQQMGETLPAIWKTPLNAAIAAFPESESVKWISDTIFSDRFRDYMTILMVNKRGYNGTYIWTKIKEGLDLTEEEQAAWDSARGEAALHGVGFEQFGMFRLRSDEQYKMYEESSKVIEEMTGYTPDQQDWLRRHGYRIWDVVGGLSPTNQAILQELESYKWMGSVRPLLPGRQQVILNRLELDWDDVRRYTEDKQQLRLELQDDFLTGRLGPQDYNDRLTELYDDQRKFIDHKMGENPLMTMEGRTDYYKEFNIPMPVMHPMRELMNLYFTIELLDKIDEETGEKVKDWDNFWAQREAIEDAIPEHLRQEWEDYLSRNTTRMEEVRRTVYRDYFRPYNRIWEVTLKGFTDEEQRLIKEFLYLENTAQKPTRQREIRAITTADGRKLISAFRSNVSDARVALRYANPHLDAWLYFWGRTTSFQTPEAERILEQISKEVGKAIK